MADLTPNNREEYWLQGMVDGQTTLEPNERREYWYKEIVDAIGSGGGGGGTGGGVLIVHLMQTNALDKTWAEINDADLAFMSLNMGDIKATGLVALTTAFESEYKVEVITVNMQDMSIALLHFAAESADGYPVASQ